MNHQPAPTLGELESDVMQRLWARDEPMAVRDVLDELNKSRTLAYTTVMTVLDNLHRKGMVTRRREGRSYLYAEALSQREYAGRLIADAAGRSGDRVGALMHFVDGLDPAEIRELREALNENETPRVANRHGGEGTS
ncbi:MAG: BlaI/MecI/CopY family transcriptional regulator [Actinobacteria bacterium]|nr:BlaI/MecI/CopY family transcriptional regulator [Actinomycetota bacterium]